MESISLEKMPLVWHTLNKLENAILTLQERISTIHSVNDFLTTPVGLEKLDAACMVVLAIGESVKNLDKLHLEKSSLSRILINLLKVSCFQRIQIYLGIE